MAISDDSSVHKGLPKLPDLAGLSDEKTEPNFLPDSDIKIKRGVRVDVPEDMPLSGRLSRHREPEPEIRAVEEDTHFGRTFVGYQLEQKIGQGGMGMVYKGRQVSLDRQVAIKILNKSLCDNVEFIKRFEREAKSIARITHPNIVAVYDFGKTDGIWYMVTEFVEGSNLARLIAERLVLQVEEVLPLVTQCLAGLAHVSLSGIVHRDIKPDNILITKDNVAKIADFGLAKDVTSDTDLTAVGLAMGTPSYMSPEQCMGRRLDVRSDIYSLGVTAYYALTGEKPFSGQSSFEIMTKQREYTPPPPFQLNPRLPKEVSAMIMRMIAKTPGDRFKDAEECRQAWLDLGQRLGVLQVTRSGEFRFPSASEMMLPKANSNASLEPLSTPSMSTQRRCRHRRQLRCRRRFPPA
jgi:eukaryotic-like serine/threonine-protein kinase